ncbi:hypothetical protein Ocin01_05538 [Orchesella cincta]|uniref:Uncharacterized protein n=1 Tax=Orchesella cincta TaxID=48709 RepID=A0A1D2N796_ORCCI|nr:hypothetical protein Ocin01_05538 [Orchesella cincta]
MPVNDFKLREGIVNRNRLRSLYLTFNNRLKRSPSYHLALPVFSILKFTNDSDGSFKILHISRFTLYWQ